MRTIIILLLAFLGYSQCKSQSVTIEQLSGTKWQQISPEDGSATTWEFTDSEIKETVCYKESSPLISVRKYYLTTDVPTTFDLTKVGGNSSGKYLVYYIDKSKRMFYEEVISLSNDTLKLHIGNTSDAIGGIAHMEVYKKIK